MDDNTNILIQITKFKVKKDDNSYVNSTRVLFDSCSQLFYITPQLCNRLKLKTVVTQKSSVQTFGNNCSENILEKVNLHVLALDESEICVTCFVKEICAPLNSQNIKLAKENFSHIRNILLVDSNPNNEAYQLIWLCFFDWLMNHQFQKITFLSTAGAKIIQEF